MAVPRGVLPGDDDGDNAPAVVVLDCEVELDRADGALDDDDDVDDAGEDIDDMAVQVTVMARILDLAPSADAAGMEANAALRPSSLTIAH